MNELKITLKKQIIEALNLEDITPEEIADAEPLFRDGLGLDSIDSLELIVLLKKHHGVKIKNKATGRKVLHSIDTMAAYIEEYKSGKE